MLTAELGGKIFAQAMAGLAAITGAFLRIHALFQPNVLDIFSGHSQSIFLSVFCVLKKQFIYTPLFSAWHLVSGANIQWYLLYWHY